MDIVAQKIGLVSFSSNVTLHPTQIRAARDQKTLLNIDWGDYQGHGWNEIASEIVQITAETLQIFNNQYEPILRQLSPVSFPNLIKLYARNNSIVSIECLINYKCPQLKELDLAYNYIISARPFAKMDLSNLEVLYLQHNPFANRQDFFKVNFRNIKKIELSSKQQLLKTKNINMSFDPITWKIKLQHQIRYEDQANRYIYYYGNHDQEQLTYIHYKQQLRQKFKSQNMVQQEIRFHDMLQYEEIVFINDNDSGEDW